MFLLIIGFQYAFTLFDVIFLLRCLVDKTSIFLIVRSVFINYRYWKFNDIIWRNIWLLRCVDTTSLKNVRKVLVRSEIWWHNRYVANRKYSYVAEKDSYKSWAMLIFGSFISQLLFYIRFTVILFIFTRRYFMVTTDKKMEIWQFPLSLWEDLFIDLQLKRNRTIHMILVIRTCESIWT